MKQSQEASSRRLDRSVSLRQTLILNSVQVFILIISVIWFFARTVNTVDNVEKGFEALVKIQEKNVESHKSFREAIIILKETKIDKTKAPPDDYKALVNERFDAVNRRLTTLETKR